MDESFVEWTRESVPTYRVRIALVHTLKDGWRLSETTVEAVGAEIHYDTIEEHLQSAYEKGTKEAWHRNRRDRKYNEGVEGEIPGVEGHE